MLTNRHEDFVCRRRMSFSSSAFSPAPHSRKARRLDFSTNQQSELRASLPSSCSTRTKPVARRMRAQF